MDELFKVDIDSYWCGCLPKIWSQPLGLRTHSRTVHSNSNANISHIKHSKGVGSSLLNNNSKNSTPNTTKPNYNSFDKYNAGTNSNNSYNNGLTMSNTSYRDKDLSNNASSTSAVDEEDEEEVIFEPSTLHKYSNDMRQTHFNYYSEDDESLLPSFNLSLNNEK